MSDDLIIGLVLAFFAAAIAVSSNAWLARRNKQIEERTRFLIDAYMDLEFGHPRNLNENSEPYSEEELREMNRRFNRAFVAINLMGSKEQIELSRAVPSNEDHDFTELTLNLRDSLRKELMLEKVDVGHFWWEVRRPKKLEETKK